MEKLRQRYKVEDVLEHRKAGGKGRNRKQPRVLPVISFPVLSTVYAISPTW